MSEGITPDLLWVSLVVLAVGFFIMSRILTYGAALLVACVRVSIPLIYFSWFFDGTWTFLDDMTYLSQGQQILFYGYNPVTILADLDFLESLSGGHHILYPWWNVLGVYLFGGHYYSPVFLNIILTFVSAFFMYRLAILCGFKLNYAKALAVFILFHWEILLWSSFINLKDIMVMTLTIIMIYFLIKLSKRLTIFGLCIIVGTTFLFYWIRFYIPLIITSTTFIWFISTSSRKRKFILTSVTVLCTAWAWSAFGFWEKSSHREALSVATYFYNLTRMVLTPQPWSVEAATSFLFIPSILHWFMLIPIIIVSFNLWNKFNDTKLLLIYLILGLLFYSSTELIGPRQRLQLMFIIAWLQFHFFWITLVNRNPGQNVLQDEKGIY